MIMARRGLSVEKKFAQASRFIADLHKSIDNQIEAAAYLESSRRLALCKAGKAKYITRAELMKKIRAGA